MQTRDHCLPEPLEVSLLAELPGKLLVDREVLPRLHHSVNSVEVYDGFSFSFPLSLIELCQHLVEVLLLAQDEHLVVVNLTLLAVQVERSERRERATEHVQAVSAASDARRLAQVAHHLELGKTVAYQVKLVLVDVQVSLLLDVCA